MCVHEIQFLCEHSTVIYTSIVILHWGFCATATYPDGVARCGGMVSETHQCYAPIHSMRLCVLCCGNDMRTVRWNTTVCRPVYYGVPDNSSTKESWHTRYSLFCCTYVYERMFMHGPNMPISLSGRDACLACLVRIWSVAGVFCFHIPFLQVMCNVHGLVMTCSFTTIPVPARLLLNIVVRYVHVAFLQMV